MEKKAISKAKTNKREKGEKTAVGHKEQAISMQRNERVRTKQIKGSNKISLCQTEENTDSPNSFS